MVVFLIIFVFLFVFILLFLGGISSSSNSEQDILFSYDQDEIDDDSKWEVVYRDSQRWKELGYNGDEGFPGYGRLYKREFKSWYCDIGSKEPKNTKIIVDTFPANYKPKDYEMITGSDVSLDWLERTKGYEELLTGVDITNRKRWYFALISTKPQWIEVRRAKIEVQEIKAEIVEIPCGGYFGQTMPVISVKPCHSERCGNSTKKCYSFLKIPFLRESPFRSIL